MVGHGISGFYSCVHDASKEGRYELVALIKFSLGHEGANYMYFNLLAAALPANVCFTYYHLALPSNQAVSYSMLQLRIMWLTLFSVYFILELSIVLVLGLLYICSTGVEIYSCGNGKIIFFLFQIWPPKKKLQVRGGAHRSSTNQTSVSRHCFKL